MTRPVEGPVVNVARRVQQELQDRGQTLTLNAPRKLSPAKLTFCVLRACGLSGEKAYKAIRQDVSDSAANSGGVRLTRMYARVIEELAASPDVLLACASDLRKLAVVTSLTATDKDGLEAAKQIDTLLGRYRDQVAVSVNVGLALEGGDDPLDVVVTLPHNETDPSDSDVTPD